MRRSLLLLFAALALLAAGCGSDDDESTATSGGATATAEAPAAGGETAAAGDVVVVDMKNIQFDPKEVEVDVGQTVRWENMDTVDHDAVSTSGDEFESELFGKGGTFEYTAEKPGTIEYECTVHPGMVGTIVVR